MLRQVVLLRGTLHLIGTTTLEDTLGDVTTIAKGHGVMISGKKIRKTGRRVGRDGHQDGARGLTIVDVAHRSGFLNSLLRIRDGAHEMTTWGPGMTGEPEKSSQWTGMRIRRTLRSVASTLRWMIRKSIGYKS